MFRNVKGLIFNVVEHANAKKVEVSVSKDDKDICVILKDDEIGFESSKMVSDYGFGIFSVQEQLEQLDGYLEIESKPDLGSRYTIKVPLKLKGCFKGVEKYEYWDINS